MTATVRTRGTDATNAGDVAAARSLAAGTVRACDVRVDRVAELISKNMLCKW